MLQAKVPQHPLCRCMRCSGWFDIKLSLFKIHAKRLLSIFRVRYIILQRSLCAYRKYQLEVCRWAEQTSMVN